MQLRQQRQEEEDEAEYERIEAMRKPLAVVGFCPHCGEQTELQPSAPELTTFLMWVCGRCSNLCRVPLNDCHPVD